MFKLSQGEYVASEKLELALMSSPYIGQIFVYGEPSQSYLVAIVVPDPLELIPLLKQGNTVGFEKHSTNYNKIPTLSTDLETWLPPFKEFCSGETATGKLVSEFLLKEINRISKHNKFRGFEFVKRIHVEGKLNNLMQGFSVDNDLLTPTFKLKRPNIKDFYQGDIQEMYKQQN